MKTPVSIIIPTYNEAENVRHIVPKIVENLSARGISAQIIVVDDDSPDGTWKAAEELSAKYPVISLRRQGERGLSSAVIHGLRFVKTDIAGFMDADSSHPVETIIDLIRPIQEGKVELTIGSRYVDAGVTSNWPWTRRLTSKVATWLARPFTSVKDPMSGFVFFRKDVVAGVPLSPVGFKIGLEIIAKGKYKNLLEVPIIFKDRLYGESKLSGMVMFDYIKQLWQLLWEVETVFGQFIKFCAVGASGVLVNLLVYTPAVFWLHFHYLAAAVLAFLVAVTSNFFLNRIWTFRWARENEGGISRQFRRFAFVCIVGLGVNLAVLFLLADVFSMHKILSQLLAVLMATIVNFAGSRRWAFAR